ncbi:amidase 1-like isoform X2 [Manihot esculenta]|uniref:amidase 1-like isoform X2 n=1 Tax=Manihot esculenta TaxID=3983 RepID=UPI001CC4319A|nr:amidase 1-like isoform X2 [Manihot esculenta]
MARSSDYGAFMEKFELKPTSSSPEFPLNGLTFAVKDIFDVDGLVTGFGNPDWARTHSAATSTAPAVLAILRGGATCVGKTVMDEMAYRTREPEGFLCSCCLPRGIFFNWETYRR